MEAKTVNQPNTIPISIIIKNDGDKGINNVSLLRDMESDGVSVNSNTYSYAAQKLMGISDIAEWIKNMGNRHIESVYIIAMGEKTKQMLIQPLLFKQSMPTDEFPLAFDTIYPLVSPYQQQSSIATISKDVLLNEGTDIVLSKIYPHSYVEYRFYVNGLNL